MKNYPIWKSFTVVSLVLLGIIFAIPSIIYDENSENWFLKNKINLGLDLQGGSYLLLEVQLDVLYKEELDNFVDSARLISRDKTAKIEKIDIQENEVVVFFGNKEKIKDIRDSFFQMYRGVTLQINNNKLSIKLNDEYRKIIQDSAIKQSLEIVRKRIDESGTKEPLIQRSGKKRILLQLPGVKDPERIKDLLGKTAKLTFHIVDNDNTTNVDFNTSIVNNNLSSKLGITNENLRLEHEIYGNLLNKKLNAFGKIFLETIPGDNINNIIDNSNNCWLANFFNF